MWECRLADTMTGLLGEPIDVPRLSWSVSVSDCSLSTTRDKGAGDYTGSGITVPWTALPWGSQGERERALASYRRALVLMWDGAPVVFGAIGPRTDTWHDTSFSLLSAMGILNSRHLFPEGTFGTGSTWAKDADYQHEGEQEGTVWGTTTSSVALSGLSLRAIASEVVRLCTSGKRGGELPIDLPYLGEPGTHQRTYWGYNVANASCRRLLENISNVTNGPDLALRPYLADQAHVRLTLDGGTDADPYVHMGGEVPMLTCRPGGGTLKGLKVACQGPCERVLATGAGQETAMLCHQSEDMTLCEQGDPWPLMEATMSDTDCTTPALLGSHADVRLAGMSRPVVQMTGTVDAADPHAPQPGVVWPGQHVDVAIEGFPTLPDGTYHLRLMEMSGTAGPEVALTFDAIQHPTWARGGQETLDPMS